MSIDVLGYSVRWLGDLRTGTNLLQVAIHELGHSLGLGHSDVQTAIMAPFYREYKPNVKLDQDDIAGIRSLYGRSTYQWVMFDADKTTLCFQKKVHPFAFCNN